MIVCRALSFIEWFVFFCPQEAAVDRPRCAAEDQTGRRSRFCGVGLPSKVFCVESSLLFRTE